MDKINDFGAAPDLKKLYEMKDRLDELIEKYRLEVDRRDALIEELVSALGLAQSLLLEARNTPPCSDAQWMVIAGALSSAEREGYGQGPGAA